MSQKKKSLSNPKVGMSRSRSHYLKEDSVYTFMYAGQSVDESGNKLTLSNEHSNILASRLKSGYLVSGKGTDIITGKTYFLLYNPSTNVSEFGFIQNDMTFTELSDNNVECKGCGSFNSLADPLESITQTAHQTYVTLLEDSCNNCLNLHADFPVGKILIKRENIGSIAVFADDRNEPRYIELDDLVQYASVGEDVCGSGTVETCLDCDKLRIFKLYKNPVTVDYERVLGGGLPMGMYEVLFAYSDELGNELSSYTPVTCPVSIFDENNIAHTQEDNNAETNFSIRVTLDGIDQRYTHYKVAVIYTTGETISAGTSIQFIGGVFSTSNNNIIISDINGDPITLNEIIIPKRSVQSWAGITESNGILFGYGIKEYETVNLQPVVNFLGLALKWTSTIAKEGLYENADSAQYKGYNRDEVVPFSIEFLSDDGYKFPIYPLIPRSATAAELVVIDNLDSQSINANVSDCDGTLRDKTWQFYNTAASEGFCSADAGTNPITQITTAITSIAVPAVPPGSFDIPEEDIDGYTNLTAYINANADTCGVSPYTGSPISSLCQYLDLTNLGIYNQMPSFDAQCDDPEVTLSGTSGTANVIINGNNYLATFATSLTVTASDFVTAHAATILSAEDVVVTSLAGVLKFVTNSTDPSLGIDNVTGDLSGTITSPTLTNEIVEVTSVTNESPSLIDKIVGDYIFVIPSDACFLFLDETDANVDEDFSSAFFLRAGITPAPTLNKTVRTRIFTTFADSPTTAVTVQNVDKDNFDSFIPISYVHPWYGLEQDSTTTQSDPDVAFASMVTTKVSFVVGSTLDVDDIGGGVPLGTDVIVYPPTIAGTGATVAGTTLSGYFTDNVNLGALWFKIPIDGRDKFFVEFVKLLEPNNQILRYDYGATAVLEYFRNRFIRYNIFDSPTTNTAVKGAVIELDSSALVELTSTDTAGSTDGFMYMSVELPIAQGKGVGQLFHWDDVPSPAFVHCGVTVPLGSCFSVHTRDEEFSKITVSYDNINLAKVQTYEASCTYFIPVAGDCEPVAYEFGDFGYYESTLDYPDNDELYDSSTLTIFPVDIPDLTFRAKFEAEYVAAGITPEYDLSTAANFVCKPIRHYRMPDNRVSSFMTSSPIGSSTSAVIYPLGVSLDNGIINSFLDIAVNNNLITQARRDNIIGYKIHRGDATLHRSIQSSGLLYDMKVGDKNGEDYHFSNFPYNANGLDKLYQNVTPSTNSNHLWTLHTPETDYYRPSISSELSFQGYQFGESSGFFDEVEDHEKMVILGTKARTLATTLAVIEVVAEVAVQLANPAEVYRVALGLGSSSANPWGIGFHVAAIIALGVSALTSNVGRYRYQWLKSFRDLGTPNNFGYYYSSIGNYNKFEKNVSVENNLRGLSIKKYLKEGVFTVQDNVTADQITINNLDRERSVILSSSDTYPITYDATYFAHDNNSTNPGQSSQPIASEGNCIRGVSEEFKRRIASPYVALKNYIPNQYGTIDSVNWKDTCYVGDLSVTNDCEVVLGGDTFIARHSIKRKMRMFRTDAYGIANLSPFAYKLLSNVTEAKYYIDYEVISEGNVGSQIFPNIDYDIQTDCGTSEDSFYVEPPKKFYLYYYGTPYYLTETRINTNYRHAQKDPWDQFYPQNLDFMRLSQEKEVSIRRPNTFFYNKVYSYEGTSLSNPTLPDYYSKEVFNKQSSNPNTVMYSRPDTNDNSLSEPWLNYRPNDYYVFPASYGKLAALKGIENGQVLGTFDQRSVVFNAVDIYVNGLDQSNEALGTGGVFGKRPRTFVETDLGYLGSQSKEILSNEFGHIIVDTIRGQIFNVNPGAAKNAVSEISRYSNGKPNGMDVWFKEHLPFKILKDFPDFVDHIDNAYAGVGITMGWDSKFRRVFITKKDYIGASGTTYNGNGTFTNNLTVYSIQDAIKQGVLEDVSWTITYKPEKGAWESYMPFSPNYYIDHVDYFQTGVNIIAGSAAGGVEEVNSGEEGLWSHLLTNRSKGVFYGKAYPFIVEYVVKNEYMNKDLEGIALWTEAKRYQNEYDYATDDTITFNKVVIFSDRECSHNLNLIPNDGTVSQLSKYPITNGKDSQDILISQHNKKWIFNHFYNRRLSDRNNLPMFNWDFNVINKTVNTGAVSFYNKSVLEQMSSETFLVRLTYDQDTRYDIELKFATALESLDY